MHTPSTSEIGFALKNGADIQDIEEMYYPGERSRHKARASKYPIPEGSGREPSPSCDFVKVFKRGQHTIGCRAKTRVYIQGVYIGTINEIREGVCDIHYETHDGERFAHWGGPQGAEWHLINRYWAYGNPPKSLTESIIKVFSKFGGELRQVIDRGRNNE